MKKAVKGFDGYFIDKMGTLYSIFPRANQLPPKTARIIKPWLNKGHLVVGLSKNKKIHKRYVHRLVLETFFGKCPYKKQCCHKNGNPIDNRLENLRWGTHTENQNDRLKHGTDNRGEKHGMHKLTKEGVLMIRQLYKTMMDKDLAIKFKISPTNVRAICKRRSWKWLK